MRITLDLTIMRILGVISWIIFVGRGIEAGNFWTPTGQFFRFVFTVLVVASDLYDAGTHP